MPHAVDPDLRIDVLAGLATMAFLGNQFDVAQQFAEEAVTLARSNDRPGKLGFTVTVLGRIFSEQGDYDHAETLIQESLQLARQVPHLYNSGHPLMELGEVAMGRGDWAAAQAHLAQAIPCLVSDYKSDKSIGGTVLLAIAYTNLAEVALAYDNPSQARHELSQALPQARWHMRLLRVLLITLAGLLLHKLPTTQTQQVAAAAQLLGAVAGLTERSGGSYSPLFQALLAQRSDQAQQFLTQLEWQAAWQVGHTWTLAQAAAEAERWLALDFEG
jgi:tetratricopeptide (TPR) repeat protein